MAVQAKAKGNGPNTGMLKSVPPDEVTNVRSPTGAGYGMNGYPGCSSVQPGKRTLSPLASNLESSVDDDGALAEIISKGTARIDSEITGQLREIGDGNVPNHPHMKPANFGGAPNGRIPTKIGAVQGEPVRNAATNSRIDT